MVAVKAARMGGGGTKATGEYQRRNPIEKMGTKIKTGNTTLLQVLKIRNKEEDIEKMRENRRGYGVDDGRRRGREKNFEARLPFCWHCLIGLSAVSYYVSYT